MNTSNCKDLCTAAKCEELENRIKLLEQDLALLLAAFSSHVEQQIPEAHQYTPEVTVNVAIAEGDLIVDVTVDGQNDFSAVPLPKLDPFVTFDIFPTGENIYEFVVSVNGDSDSDILDLSNQDNLDVYVGYNSQNQIEVLIQLGEQEAYDSANLPNTNVSVDFFNNDENGALLKVQVGNDFDEDYIKFPEPEKHVKSNLQISAIYLGGVLFITVDDGESFDSTQVFIDPSVTNNFGGGSVSCDAVDLKLDELLAAIAVVNQKVTEVNEIVTVEVEATALSEFECPKEVEEGENQEEQKPGTEQEIKLPTLPALHEQLKLVNDNQVSIYQYLCQNLGVLAFPDWWQVRLGADVPQIVCGFRKVDTSTYHSYAIPHPRDTGKPNAPLLPPFTKGNWQGMIVCKDNSKFIINCETKEEAERMCGIAAQLIDNTYLELPPRIYVGERKGQAVGVATMIPATIQYFDRGQQNIIPKWRVRVDDLE